jgi:hypothetical protein
MSRGSREACGVWHFEQGNWWNDCWVYAGAVVEVCRPYWIFPAVVPFTPQGNA